jgi:hypothetical protein
MLFVVLFRSAVLQGYSVLGLGRKVAEQQGVVGL